MQLDIVNQIKTDKLDYMIHEIGKKNISYLVMTRETIDAIAYRNHDTLFYNGGISQNTAYAKYRDIPVATYEGMKYGEVSIVGEIEYRPIAPFIEEG